MTDQYGAPFGTYPAITGTSIPGAAITAVNAVLQGFYNLLSGDLNTAANVGNTSMQQPDFNKINPGTRQKLLDEVTAMMAVVTNAT